MIARIAIAVVAGMLAVGGVYALADQPTLTGDTDDSAVLRRDDQMDEVDAVDDDDDATNTGNRTRTRTRTGRGKKKAQTNKVRSGGNAGTTVAPAAQSWSNTGNTGGGGGGGNNHSVDSWSADSWSADSGSADT